MVTHCPFCIFLFLICLLSLFFQNFSSIGIKMTKTTKTKQCTCLHDQRINKNIATTLVKKKGIQKVDKQQQYCKDSKQTTQTTITKTTCLYTYIEISRTQSILLQEHSSDRLPSSVASNFLKNYFISRKNFFLFFFKKKKTCFYISINIFKGNTGNLRPLLRFLYYF